MTFVSVELFKMCIYIFFGIGLILYAVGCVLTNATRLKQYKTFLDDILFSIFLLVSLLFFYKPLILKIYFKTGYTQSVVALYAK